MKGGFARRGRPHPGLSGILLASEHYPGLLAAGPMQSRMQLKALTGRQAILLSSHSESELSRWLKNKTAGRDCDQLHLLCGKTGIRTREPL